MTRRLLTLAALVAAIAALLWLESHAPKATADPARPCTATAPCLTPQYCPDTGGFVVGYQPCSSLITGPYAPGGLRPNDD